MRNDDMNEEMKKILSEERNSISPKGNIKNKLDQAFEAKHGQRSILPLWMTYPVPAWQMAACIAILVAAGITLIKFQPKATVSTELAVADTVYIEKIIPGKRDTVFIEKKAVATQRTVTPVETTPVQEEAPATVNPAGYIPQEMHISDFHNIQPNGSSIGEDSSAKSWMVRIM